MDEKIESIKERFELSRANLMTQIFVTLAGAHGVGMAAVLSMIGQMKSACLIKTYLAIIVFLLGFGLISILASVFIRFEHSKIAEKEKIADLQNDTEKKDIHSSKRRPLMKCYKRLMYASVIFLSIAIFVGMAGAIHTSFFEQNIERSSK